MIETALSLKPTPTCDHVPGQYEADSWAALGIPLTFNLRTFPRGFQKL